MLGSTIIIGQDAELREKVVRLCRSYNLFNLKVIFCRKNDVYSVKFLGNLLHFLRSMFQLNSSKPFPELITYSIEQHAFIIIFRQNIK